MNLGNPNKKIKTMTFKDFCELIASGEEFELRFDPMWAFRTYKIYNSVFMYVDTDINSWVESNYCLSEIFEAEFRRKEQKPWKPENGDTYFYLFINRLGKVSTCCTNFDGDLTDLIRITTGNCFKTEEEAHKNNTVLEQYKSMKKEYQKQ